MTTMIHAAAAKPDDRHADDPHADDPFGTPARGRRKVLLLSLGAGALLVTVFVAWLATRGGASAAPEAHNHAAAPAGDSAMPVMLTAERAARIGVTYAPVILGTLPTELRTVAQVSFDETRVRTISPKIDGWVEQLYVNSVGQPVARGQALLAVYSPMLVTAQQELLLARQLMSDVSGGSAEARSGAAALRESARRRLAFWDIPVGVIDEVERSGEVQRTLVLRSSAGGVVVEKAVLSGQRIMAGDALYKVADLSTVWLEGEVFERDLPGVRLGQQVTATFEALRGEAHAGRITYIAPVLDPETRTAQVRVELANSRMTLKPGMYATIHIRTGGGRPVLSVPRSALLASGTRNLVFVQQADGMLVPRDVVPGVATADRVEIIRGLARGETVVASATFLIDAESNLGAALGGMAGMPGMDVAAPPGGPAAAPAGPAAPPPVDHSNHQE